MSDVHVHIAHESQRVCKYAILSGLPVLWGSKMLLCFIYGPNRNIAHNAPPRRSYFTQMHYKHRQILHLCKYGGSLPHTHRTNKKLCINTSSHLHFHTIHRRSDNHYSKKTKQMSAHLVRGHLSAHGSLWQLDRMQEQDERWTAYLLFSSQQLCA